MKRNQSHLWRMAARTSANTYITNAAGASTHRTHMVSSESAVSTAYVPQEHRMATSAGHAKRALRG
ncbi:MAG: hypothetical protein U9R79_01070 [Armatimonadota bacterium]|nr:hypothetical protein [Armatimonadota bacterium]